MKRIHLLLAAFVLPAAISMTEAKAQDEIPAYLDKNQPAEVRATDLVSRLTLDEKCSLMLYESPAVERLGIHAYNWWNEALHGVARNGSATVYPMPIAMAASFNPELINEVFTSVSDEARVKYRMAMQKGYADWYEGLTFWTPNINIFRDPRWGRGMETYGEDPYLTSILGDAVVRGLQGEDPENLKLHACAKHLAVHSGPESSRHTFDANVSERDLYETYLPAFKYLVTKSNVQEVMFAYNRFRGYPCGASERLLQEILREEWGYEGIILSDCWAVDDFYVRGRHEFVETAAEAAAASVNAGMQLECGVALRHLAEAVAQGLVSEETVDKAVVKLLTERYRLGDMDGDSIYEELPDSLLCSEGHRLQALQMARETMTLLMNKNDILPLAADAKVALVGPNADDAEMMWGNYNGFPIHSVTLLDALKARVPELKYAKGCEIALDEFTPERAAALVSELEGIDIVVFAGGISPRLEGEEMYVPVPGFSGGDRTTIELPQVQRDVMAALKAAGKKVILVNFSGSAIGFVPETENCEAILQAWYPGQEGGTAIVEALYGDINPSGKLPLTFYKSVDQLPEFTDYDMVGHTYRFFEGEPVYPFGYGLSYTTYIYKSAKIRFGRLVVKVKNTGDREGTETVQVYVRKKKGVDGTDPIKTLRAFRKVTIPAGKTRKVVIKLDKDMFDWWSWDEGRVVPTKGRFDVMVGGSSADADLVHVNYLRL